MAPRSRPKRRVQHSECCHRHLCRCPKYVLISKVVSEITSSSSNCRWKRCHNQSRRNRPQEQLGRSLEDCPGQCRRRHLVVSHHNEPLPHMGASRQLSDVSNSIRSVAYSSKTWDVTGSKQDDLTAIINYPYHGGVNQQFTLTRVGC